MKKELFDTESKEDFVAQIANHTAKFEVFGEEIIVKEVKRSGSSGRIYLPPNWVGHRVKIVRASRKD